MSEIVAEVLRNQRIESVHRGHIAVVEPDGTPVAGLGNPELKTYMRSAAKPFQVMPFLESPAGNRYGFTEAELALIMASHNGEPIHVQTVAGMLQKLGLNETHLQCGFHLPLHEESARAHIRQQSPHSPLYNNCSGKHTGMLALAKYNQWPLQTYLQPDHPVQVRIKETISRFSGLKIESIETGVDGCSAPVFYLPVASMARMYANLAAEKTATAKRVFAIMTRHPQMVAGTGRFDTEFMQVLKGLMVSKVGAEGVRCATIKSARPLGIALKIEDGNKRVSAAVLLEVLRQTDLISKRQLQQLHTHYRPVIRNCAGREVGEIRPVFKL